MNDMVQVLELLTWLLPPVIGALIGYITNDIAIKMLFRPLRAYHIGKFRIPLTPGIIPRQRDKLAESIGLMVSRELITEDAIRRQISSPNFQSALSARISDLSSIVLYTPLQELGQKIKSKQSAPLESRDSDKPDTMLVQDILSAFFRSDAFFHGLGSSLSLALDSFFHIRVKDLAGQGGGKFFHFLKTNIHLNSAREPLKKLVRDLTIEGIQKNTPLHHFLSPKSIDGIVKGVDRLYPAMARELLTFLRTPHIHATLEKRGRKILRKLISRMSSLQRLFLMAGQYDRNIDEQMGEIIDDSLEQLEIAIGDDETRKKILETLRTWLQKLSSHTVADVAGIWGESLPSDVEKAVDALFNLFSSEKASEWSRSIFTRLLDKYGDAELGELICAVTDSTQAEITKLLSEWVLELIRTVETGSGTAIKFFKQLISSLSDDGRRSVADIVTLGSDHKERLDRILYRFVLGVLDTQIPAILESVDVRTLVVEKINSLDIEKVEELILIVIRTHLRWIILFGALLGFLIGSMQVALTKFL